jgi:hypothetical protein
MLTLGDRARSNEIIASQKQAKFITIEVRRLSHCIGAGQELARRGMPRRLQQRETTVRDDDPAALGWRESSACWDSQCVTVAAFGGRVLVRDTSDADKTTLAINQRDWAVFMARIRDSMKGHVSPRCDEGNGPVRSRGNGR